jgi:hypothetical protein
MKPMGSTSTPFIKYHQIRVNDIDLYEDAFGLYADFGIGFEILHRINVIPGRLVIRRLIEKIRKQE